MLRNAIASLLALVAVTSAATSANAQSCKNETVVATGRSSLTLNGARDNAIVAWRREVIARFGVFWAEFDQARNKSVATCAHTNLRIFVSCEARGQPCMVSQSEGSPLLLLEPAKCNASDSKNCDPYVKAMQLRLTQKGCRTKADGSAGPSTSAALRCFQQKAKLTVTGEVDLATVEALRK